MQKHLLIILLLLMFLLPSFCMVKQAKGQTEIISLTQAPCQFIEVEDQDYRFVSEKKADCEAINNRTTKERISRSEHLKLHPGDYIFRVTNKDIPYQVGFYLRSADVLDRLKLPSVSGAGLFQGITKDYKIKLVPGEYRFSCPLNSTPDYSLTVTD